MPHLAEETEAILSDLPPAHRALVEGLAQQLRNFLAHAGMLGQLALAIVSAEVADSLPDEDEVADANG